MEGVFGSAAAVAHRAIDEALFNPCANQRLHTLSAEQVDRAIVQSTANASFEQ